MILRVVYCLGLSLIFCCGDGAACDDSTESETLIYNLHEKLYYRLAYGDRCWK
jgi:hypothetical protein